MKQLLILILSGILLSLASCMGEEEYSVSDKDRLVFSKDTLAFDTVIAGESTNTYDFWVFNPNKKALRISSVTVGQGNASPFEVNVDGTWLANGFGNDFTISAEDSLRVFVQLTAPTTDEDTPQSVEDFIHFQLESGLGQRVVMMAQSQDVNILRGEIIEENTIFQSKRPYQIYDSLVVAKGTTLELSAGTRLYFHANASLIVHGTLKAKGTLEQPVVMRGDRLGNMFTQQAYDDIPNQWGGITFTASSLGNDMTWCDIHSGNYGIHCDSTGIDKQKLIIDNSIIHNVTGDAFYAKYCQTFVGNSQITNAGGDCVNIFGGDHTFVHCTIGQFYSFTGGHGVALSFTNVDNDIPLPLTRCQFINTLITGNNEDDIMGSASERYQDCAFSYIFKNCLLNTPKVESEAIQDCKFEEDTEDKELRKSGNFSPAFDFDKLKFYFTLSPKSAAANSADITLTQQSGYTTDLLGRPRLADGTPDIGAYEAQPEEETEQ